MAIINGNRVGLVVQTMSPQSNIKSGTTDPTPTVVADFIGQEYLNTTSGRMFYCSERLSAENFVWLPLETSNNKVTTITAQNSDTEYPSAKAVYDEIANQQLNIDGKVDKETGKSLSTNDYTTAEKSKLAGIAAGAQVNVQSDWNATSGDACIKNKPVVLDGEDGVGIQSVVQTTTSTADSGDNIVTVTKTDGTSSTFTVKNGSKGSTGAKGDKGDNGAQGIQGEQGIQGIKGDKGDTGLTGETGSNGTTFIPSINANGVISWTNDGGKTNPTSIDLVTAVLEALPIYSGGIV